MRTLAVVMPCREREEEDLTEKVFEPGIYPNPSALNFTLQSEIEPETEIALTIFDIAGKAINSFKNIRSTSFTFGENLSPGIYFAEIISGNNRKIIKLVKNNY